MIRNPIVTEGLKCAIEIFPTNKEVQNSVDTDLNKICPEYDDQWYPMIKIWWRGIYGLVFAIAMVWFILQMTKISKMMTAK